MDSQHEVTCRECGNQTPRTKDGSECVCGRPNTCRKCQDVIDERNEACHRGDLCNDCEEVLLTRAMANPLDNIDGKELREQSEWLLGRLRNAELSDSADAYPISGLVNLMDAIRDYCHDQNGVDCLLIDPDTKDRGAECPKCGSTVCIG